MRVIARLLRSSQCLGMQHGVRTRCFNHGKKTSVTSCSERDQNYHTSSSLLKPSEDQTTEGKTRIEWKDIMKGNIVLPQRRTPLEKYHTVKTPRLFLLQGSESFKDIAVLPLEQSSGNASRHHSDEVDKLVDKFAVERSLSTVDIRQLSSSLFSLSHNALRDILQSDGFNMFFTEVAGSCPGMSQGELEDIVFNLALLRYKVHLRSISKEVVKCCEALYDKSVVQCHDWPLRQLMKFCDAFSLFGITKGPLQERLMQRVEDEVPDLTRPEVLQTIFLVGETRQSYPDLMSQLEARFFDLLRTRQLSFVEVGTVCSAFFKSSSTVSSGELMDELRDLLFATELAKFPSYHIVGILKVFRHYYYGYNTLFETVGKQIAAEVNKYPIKSVMQFTLTFATLHIFSQDLMDAAARQIPQQIHRCRSKDVAKLMWSYATMNHEPPQSDVLFGMLQTRVREMLDEMGTYPVYLMLFLLSSAYLSIYPVDLLNHLFSEEFMQRMKEYERKEGFDLRSDLVVIEASARIECPDKLKHRLDMDYLVERTFPSDMCVNAEEDLRQRSELREVAECLKAIMGGASFIKVHNILPYMKTADIEIHVDESNSPIPVRTSSSSQSHLDVTISDDVINQISGLHQDRPRESQPPVRDDNSYHHRTEGGPPSDYEKWLQMVQLPPPVPSSETRIVVEVSSRNHHHFGGKKLLGLHSMKRRQLRKLGYHVIEIPYHDWDLVSRHGEGIQHKYLRQRVLGSSKGILDET